MIDPIVAPDPARRAAVLVLTLQAAVPLRIAELAELTPNLRAGVINAWVANAVEPLCARGDVLQFSGKSKAEKRDCADTFNHLARALAALAWNPGGVRLLGILWCARHLPWGRAATAADDLVCVRCALHQRLAAAMRRRCGEHVPPASQPRRRIDTIDLLSAVTWQSTDRPASKVVGAGTD